MMNSLRYEGPTSTANLKLELSNYVGLINAVGSAIREAKSLPSGTLYAMVMGSMDLRTYNNIIGVLKRTGMVREQSYLLTWTGPDITK